VQQAVLRSFATTGHAPDPADLAQVARACGRDFRDALGIPEMFGTDAVVTSADPVTGAPIAVNSTSRP
jgi:hypothetical protein